MELAVPVDRAVQAVPVDPVASLIARHVRAEPVRPVVPVEQVVRVVPVVPVVPVARVVLAAQEAGAQALAPAGAEIRRVHLVGQADVLRAGESPSVPSVKSLTIWKHHRWAACVCHAVMGKVSDFHAAPASPISLTKSMHHRLTW